MGWKLRVSEMKEKIAVISVFTNLLLAIGKVIVGIAANSVAVLSDGIHSGMDVISSVISFLGINIAKKPIDRGHPMGTTNLKSCRDSS
jgi:divalent metal cation (Fe/Co/Zn/Cd) transporter